ncbi:MAG TPA: GHMP kinase [Armatimonadetes bacterium]|nr:GHMP kinase [Armatimonadota bacterium]
MAFSDVRTFEGEVLTGSLRGFFPAGGEVIVSRAPGRLDVLGGVIDYTGGTVCEMPLREAAVLGLQKRPDRQVRVRSLNAEAEGLTPEWTFALDDLLACADYPQAQEFFRREPGIHWTGYVAGAFYVLARERGVRFPAGANLALRSEVPLGAGVSSSAALEIAAMQAICLAYGLELDGLTKARLAQMVENRVVGAPCGLMDQLTSLLGREYELLIIRCQPDVIEGSEPLPEGVQVAGINSGVKHSVGGSRYTDARVGAYMGHKIILTLLQEWGTTGQEDPFRGYLSQVPPAEFWAVYRPHLPAQMRGQEFLDRYGDILDAVTRVEPDRVYKIRSRAEHHVSENARVAEFRRCLASYARTRDQRFLRRAGRLMYASHWSYSRRLGMGAAETDLLVRLARSLGEERGVYGAKITGGGSGGAIALLGDDRLPAAVREIAQRYEAATGLTPDVFLGSSPGAEAFGHRLMRWG